MSEHSRTVRIVDWLVENCDEIGQLKWMAIQISDIAVDALGDKPRKGFRLRMCDHLWCDILASIVAALDEVDKTFDNLAEWIAIQSSDVLVDLVWPYFTQSRQTDTDQRPMSRRTRVSSRQQNDEKNGLVEHIVRKIIAKVISAALMPPAPVLLTYETLVLKLRILAMLLCRDPVAHRAVWDNCLSPLLKEWVADDLQDELLQLMPNLIEPMAVWGDRPPPRRKS